MSRLWAVARLGCVCLFIFFFQAEDGIRDLIVTGVQTCALPIWGVRTENAERGSRNAEQPSQRWYACSAFRVPRSALLAIGLSLALQSPDPWPILDRKSTRLNSSHDQISYAVFCLKKKKDK